MSNVAFNALPPDPVPEPDIPAVEFLKLAVLTRAQLAQSPHWTHAFAGERKDHRYYELVEDTIQPDFEYRYFAIQDDTGAVWAVQPFFVLDQDMLAGTSAAIKASADFIRRLFPRFMLMRTLMVGCAAGEGHLDGSSHLPRDVHARLLAEGITRHARELKAKLVVMKEFPAADREALNCFLDNGYARIPSMPMTQISIPYTSFDDYTNKALSRNTRSKLRKKFRATDQKPLELHVLRDITPIIDEVYPLYLNVFEKASLHFEKITKEFFCEIGQRMPDKVHFFIWRHDNKIAAFGMCMEDEKSLCAEYLGFDYTVALDLNLYYVVVRDVMSWAIANGFSCYRSTGLNYDPKYRMRYSLDPLDLYVRHVSGPFNFALKRILPLVEPTRYDQSLKRFANYNEL
jgi:hypothetical protein